MKREGKYLFQIKSIAKLLNSLIFCIQFNVFVNIFLWHFFHFKAVQNERINCNTNTRNTSNSSQRFLNKYIAEKRNSPKIAVRNSASNNSQNIGTTPVVADSTTSPVCMSTHSNTNYLSVASMQWNSSVSSFYSPNYYTITSNAFTQMARIIFSTGSHWLQSQITGT